MERRAMEKPQQSDLDAAADILHIRGVPPFALGVFGGEHALRVVLGLSLIALPVDALIDDKVSERLIDARSR